MKIDAKLDDAEFRQVLQRLQDRGANLAPPLKASGEALVASTKRRFQESRAPDGTAWAPNSPVTFENLLSRYTGSVGKGRRITSKGAGRVASKKPLIGETKALSTTIAYQVFGNALEIGSPMEYAAVQQFGAKKGAFGNTRRGAPIPWGDIPARPFLGISPEDAQTLREIFSDYLDVTG